MGNSEPATSNVADILYPVGKILTLDARLDAASNHQLRTIQVKIKRQQLPYTFSSGAVVEEVSDFLDKSEGNQFFLKMCDRRAAEELRDEYGVPPWSDDIENVYVNGVQSGAVEAVHKGLRDVPDFLDDNGSDWDEGEDEAFLDDWQRKLYEAEVETYDRLKEYQGQYYPRLLATVKLDISPPNAILSAEQRELHQQKGFLLQYLHGFTLRDMIAKAPAAAWQDIVDQGIKTVDILGDHDIVNKDVRLDNFIIVPRIHTYQVFMIDFGLCRFRRPDESDAEWGRVKCNEDEEGFLIVTAGASQAIELSGFSLCDKCDGVLLGRPHYGNFPIDLGYRAEARIVGVSFGDVDPFSLEAVEYYEKALINAQEQGTRIKDAGVALKAMEEKMTKTLLKEKIFVTSGSDFGTDVSGWYRIVFAHERTYLLEGLERMVRAVKEFGHDSSR
ncbi:hypothetical protein FPOA_10575 [Fusarium poae]|uniref:Protein kinase domain-containing protein n=1 Tax=Fusarium poae TaxID=36050 RepID=A0A1B8AED8_FUSPO|nr:hypothetical protein FPOA_10575 [Fusarium poae]